MKKNNIIIIGGTIAAGKSTLTNNLANKFSWKAIPELRNGDKIQELILNKLYEGKRMHIETIQYYFLINRLSQYIDATKNKMITILDRGLWEDIIFAKLLSKNVKKKFSNFKLLWKLTIQDTIKQFGLPKVYIFLKIDWNTFKKRIYERNRLSEINNFYKNKNYFKALIKEYNENFNKILAKWNIPIIVINVINLSQKDVLKKTIKLLKNYDIL